MSSSSLPAESMFPNKKPVKFTSFSFSFSLSVSILAGCSVAQPNVVRLNQKKLGSTGSVLFIFAEKKKPLMHSYAMQWTPFIFLNSRTVNVMLVVNVSGCEPMPSEGACIPLGVIFIKLRKLRAFSKKQIKYNFL